MILLGRSKTMIPSGIPTPFFGFSLLLSILVFSGCQSSSSRTSNDALQPGETIWICNAVHVVKTESTEARILADGTVTLPFIGAIRLAGLTISEAERTVEDAYQVSGLYRHPQILILREQKPKGGNNPLAGGRTKKDATP